MTYKPHAVVAPSHPTGFPLYFATTDPAPAGEYGFVDTNAPNWAYPDRGHNSDSREDPLSRGEGNANINTTSIAQGQVYFSYFTARATRTDWTKLGTISGTGTASTGATTCKLGIFGVDVGGDLTRLAVTANTTSILQTANTEYEIATTASYDLDYGFRYCTAFLQVGGSSANGSIKGQTSVAFYLAEPRMCSRTTTGQTDILASYSAAAATASETANLFYTYAAA